LGHLAKKGTGIMVKRIFAICLIYGCTAIAWTILSGTIVVRTETQDNRLRGAIGQLWGTEQTQQAPKFYYESENQKVAQVIEASDITADINLDYRKKGLLWYSTYKVKFAGKYQVKNNFDKERQITMDFKFPVKGAIYDNFRCVVKGREIEEITFNQETITKSFKVAPGQVENIQISYESQGLSKWSYDFGENVNQVKNFSLILNTNFEEIDFPADSISPTHKEQDNGGWKLTWQYSSLLTGFKIGMLMPRKLNPGPWVSRVTMAAPVSLFLFFFLLFIFTTVRKIKIHPMNYFFVASAFFSFHLLLAYLIDHISIHLAFWICSLVSVFLVVSYMRLVVGRRFAFIEVALSQLIYLVFFSYTFFFEGYTGLTITILCICTLFIIMQATGRVDWEKLFEKSESK
jgi:inner membrane protein involved in colicin E2 resistance